MIPSWLHLPDLVGLLMASVLIGPFGLGWLNQEEPTDLPS